MSQDYYYKGYHIRVNAVPREQFIYGGFGWAYQVLRKKKLCLRMVIKGQGILNTEKDQVQIREKGLHQIYNFIDHQENVLCKQIQEYCFMIQNDMSIIPIECKDFMISR